VAYRARPDEPLTPGQRRGLLVAGVLAVLALLGVAVVAVVAPGAYGHSGAGCVTVDVASSTGGGVLHACGAQARTWCAGASAPGPMDAAVRAQCARAGLATPAAPSAASPGG